MDCDDPKLLSVHMSFDGQAHARCVLYFKGELVLLFYNYVKQPFVVQGTSMNQHIGVLQLA